MNRSNPDEEPDVGVLGGLAERASGARGVDPQHDLGVEIGNDILGKMREREIEDIDLRLG